MVKIGADDETVEIDIDSGKVAKKRLPDIVVIDERVRIKELERQNAQLLENIDTATNKIFQQDTLIRELRNRQVPTRDNTRAKIELEVLIRRIQRYKMTGKVGILQDLNAIKELL